MIEWLIANECTILRAAACVWVILASAGAGLLVVLMRGKGAEND